MGRGGGVVVAVVMARGVPLPVFALAGGVPALGLWCAGVAGGVRERR